MDHRDLQQKNVASDYKYELNELLVVYYNIRNTIKKLPKDVNYTTMDKLSTMFSLRWDILLDLDAFWRSWIH